MMRLTFLVVGAAALRTDETAGLDKVLEMLGDLRKDVKKTRKADAEQYDKVAGDCKYGQESMEKEMQEQIVDIHAARGEYDVAVGENKSNLEAMAEAHADGLKTRADLEEMVATQKKEQASLHAEIKDAQAGMNAAYVALVTIHQWQPNAPALEISVDDDVKNKLAELNGCPQLDEACNGKVAHGDGPEGQAFLQTLESEFPSAKLAGETIKMMLLQDGAEKGMEMPRGDKNTGSYETRNRDYSGLLVQIQNVLGEMGSSWLSSTKALATSKTMTTSACDSEYVDSAYGLGQVFTSTEAEFKEGQAYCLGVMRITQLNDLVHSSKENAASAEAKAGTEKGNLVQLQIALFDNKNALKKLTASCETEAKIFTHNSNLATEEFDALKTVMDVLEQGVADMKAVTAFIQIPHHDNPINFLQLGMHKSHKSSTIAHKPIDSHKAVIQHAMKFLEIKARAIKHPALTLVMMELANNKKRDPFVHVIKMINRLISTLESEATEDATHHGFCQSQMAQAKGTQVAAQNQIRKLTSDMKKAGADMDQFMQKHSQAMGQLYQDKNSLKNMNHNRATSKQENKDSMQQAKIAVTSLKKATKILKAMQIHSKHKQVFLQTENKATPYHGSQEGQSNVMSMLEVLLDRFEKQYAALKEQEHQSQTDFNAMTAELSARVAANTQRATDMSRQMVTKFGEFAQMKEDLGNQNGLLASAFEMQENLKPTCVETHADKIGKIQSTIESLQSALDILNSHGS